MNPLPSQVLTLTVTYLGPAARIFLERQTRAHMNGLKFEDLDKGHLTDLAKWVYISASLVIEREKAQELAERIKKL